MRFIDIPMELELRDPVEAGKAESMGLEYTPEKSVNSFISINVDTISYIPGEPNEDGSYSVFLVSGENLTTKLNRKEIIKRCQDE